MDIKISDIEKAFLLTMNHLKADGLTSISIDDDYYWKIPQENQYDPYVKPDNLTIGQLSEDWEWLSKVINGECEPLAYTLVYLSAIIKRIGEKRVQ